MCKDTLRKAINDHTSPLPSCRRSAVILKRHHIGPQTPKNQLQKSGKERAKITKYTGRTEKEVKDSQPLLSRAKKQCALMPRGTELQNFPTPEGKGPDQTTSVQYGMMLHA